MKCPEFNRHLPDWIAGHLSHEQNQQMQAHHTTCMTCQKTTIAERELRLRWQYLPSPPDVPALWPQLSQHIENTPSQRRFVPYSPRILGLGFAALGLSLIVLLARLPGQPVETVGTSHGVVITDVDESHVVQIVREIRQLPENENDILLDETQQDRRRLLLSREDR